MLTVNNPPSFPGMPVQNQILTWVWQWRSKRAKQYPFSTPMGPLANAAETSKSYTPQMGNESLPGEKMNNKQNNN